jgi:hypothetical protein
MQHEENGGHIETQVSMIMLIKAAMPSLFANLLTVVSTLLFFHNVELV